MNSASHTNGGDSQQLSPFHEEKSKGNIIDDLEAALTLLNIKHGTNLSLADLEAALTLMDLKTGTHTSLAAWLGSMQGGLSTCTSPTTIANDIATPNSTPPIQERRTSPREQKQKFVNQAPKTLPPLAKQNLILHYLQSSRTVHTIKDLEKSLPSVASINGMQVKDYLQALSDEGRIHVEKIGSGNWYWSFASEEKQGREDTLRKLREEKEKVDAAVGGLEEKVREASEKRDEDNGREQLIKSHLELTEEVESWKKELEGYKDADPGQVEAKRKEIRGLKAKAERWTDNIGILEGKLDSLMGGDREKMDALKREVYGDEYIEGEGLRELP